MENLNVFGRFWVKKGAKNYLGLGRIALLKGIVMTGSISQSSKSMRMSYKAAWDSIDAINNLSAHPLVERFIGGRGGSGSVLTKDGLKAIEAYDELNNAKEAFCAYFSESKDLNDLCERAKKMHEILSQMRD